MKENKRFAVHFYIVFSDLIKDREQIITMMMEKLSHDKRVEEWGYQLSKGAFRELEWEVDDDAT